MLEITIILARHVTAHYPHSAAIGATNIVELRKAKDAYWHQSAAAEAAHAADRALRERTGWIARPGRRYSSLAGTPTHRPLIADAIHGGCELLEVQCRHCNHTEMIDLSLAIWPRGKQVHTLKSALYCLPCMKEHGKKRRPDIVGIRERLSQTRRQRQFLNNGPGGSLKHATGLHGGCAYRLVLQSQERQVPAPDGCAHRQTGQGNTSEVDEMKRPGPASMAKQRELIELAKTLDLDAIVRRTGRTRKAILESARRLGISIRGRK